MNLPRSMPPTPAHSRTLRDATATGSNIIHRSPRRQSPAPSSTICDATAPGPPTSPQIFQDPCHRPQHLAAPSVTLKLPAPNGIHRSPRRQPPAPSSTLCEATATGPPMAPCCSRPLAPSPLHALQDTPRLPNLWLQHANKTLKIYAANPSLQRAPCDAPATGYRLHQRSQTYLLSTPGHQRAPTPSTRPGHLLRMTPCCSQPRATCTLHLPQGEPQLPDSGCFMQHTF